MTDKNPIRLDYRTRYFLALTGVIYKSLTQDVVGEISNNLHSKMPRLIEDRGSLVTKYKPI